MKENESVKKYLAEFIGTFVLVLFGCGVACVLGCDTPAGYLATALTFGLVIVAMAYCIGNISGCHINPAVSLAMFINNKMTLEDFIGYVIAQFLGATAGAGVLGYLVGKSRGSLGINTIATFGWGKSFIVEVILTFVFVLTIMGVSLSSRKRRGGIGLNIGIGIALSFTYILFLRFSQMFVYSGAMAPAVALWLPNLIFGIIAAFLYSRASK